MGDLTPSARSQLRAAACGYVFPVVVLVALFGTRVLPPPSPNASAPQITAYWGEHTDLKRLGIVLGFTAVGLLAPLTVTITLQLFRIEGRSPLWSLLQLITGTGVLLFIFIPLLIQLVTMFRLSRDPQITQTLTDLGWILWFTPVAPFVAQDLAIAFAVFSDRSATPVFPRWVAWANLWVAFTFVPAALIPFFHRGPFTYRGALGFWVPTLVYGAWALMMSYVTRRAIRQEAAEERAVEAIAVPAARQPELAHA